MDNGYHFFSKIPREIMSFLDTVTEGVEGLVTLVVSFGMLKIFYDVIALEGEIGFAGRLALFMIEAAGLKSVWILAILHIVRGSVFLKRDIAADSHTRVKAMAYSVSVEILVMVCMWMILNPTEIVSLGIAFGGLTFGRYFREILPVIILACFAGWGIEKRDKLLGKEDEQEDFDIPMIISQPQLYFTRLKKTISGFMRFKEKKDEKQMKIKQIKFGKFFFLSVLTCGIYSIYTLYQFNETVNILCEGDEKKSKNYIAVVLLGIVTCGIYTFYWTYKQAERLHEIAPRYRCNINTRGTKVLLWSTFGTLIFIGPAIAWYYMLKNMNQLAEQYNQGNVDEEFVIPQNRMRAGKPAAIIAGFYIFLIILYVSLLSLLLTFLLGGLGEDTGGYGNQYYEDFSLESQESYEREEDYYENGAGYELVTTEQLNRNPDRYIGKPVKLECSFMVLYNDVVINDTNGYIRIQYDKPACDEYGNEIGQALSEDYGYVEGTFDRFEDDLGCTRSMIMADRVVVLSGEETDSYADIYDQSRNLSSDYNVIFGEYESQYGETIAVFSEEGFDDKGNFYEAKVQGTDLSGEIWEGYIISLDSSPFQITTLGGKVIAQISPGDGEIAIEWRYNMGNYEWYKKI